VPPPTRDVAKSIEADLARAEQALAAMEAELKGRGPAAERLRNAKVPAARTDAYFDLATFVERMRDTARKHDVDLKPEAARFGFAAYANEGPDTDHIEPVFRQRQVAQYLLEALLEAKPRALLAVKREAPLTKQEKKMREEARLAAEAGGQPDASLEITMPEGPDYFQIDSRASARVPGFVDANAFRFVFTGQTAALRQFLNRLAGFELPVLVREVEVDVASGEEAAASTDETPASSEASPAAPASVVLSLDPAAPKPPPKKAPTRVSTATPIVSKALSKFTVTVEFIELVPPAAAAEAPAAPNP
jgi:hypothetical protein